MTSMYEGCWIEGWWFMSFLIQWCYFNEGCNSWRMIARHECYWVIQKMLIGNSNDLSISITTTILMRVLGAFSSKFLRTIHPKPTPQEFTVLRRRLQQKEPRFAAECALFARLTVAARCTLGKKRAYGKVAIHGVGIVMYLIYIYLY